MFSYNSRVKILSVDPKYKKFFKSEVFSIFQTRKFSSEI